MRFYDDRMEAIPFDEPTDLVAISVETYTAQARLPDRQRVPPARRAGGHGRLPRHLCPDEVARYAEAVVVGEAEALWPRGDRRLPRTAGCSKLYRQRRRARRSPALRPDRSIFRGKRYLPVGLVEAGRGCHFKCDFCAVQTVFGATQTRRPVGRDPRRDRGDPQHEKKLFFFVDDNITSNLAQAKEFFRALIPLKIRWVSQASINAAHDEEFLDLLARSGCMGVLIGFESLNPTNLRR